MGVAMPIDPTPELAGLIEGYRRFRATGWEPKRDRWAQLGEGQQPDTMVIACSDSRVDPAQIFDVDPGEIFVVRNVAALVPPFETTPGHHGVSAALEFAVQVLQVKQIVVMGHGLCGGCRAALTQEMHGAEPGEGGFVADWIAMLDEAREPIAAELGTTGHAAERAMELAAVKVSLANLRTFPCVRRKEREGTLKLRGAFFAISDGVLHVLDEAGGAFEPVG
jgi:carbonic anhydrase